MSRRNDPEERAALEKLANDMADKMLDSMPEGKNKDIFKAVRWVFQLGYVAGAEEVLNASQDAAVAIRTGFASAQLQAVIAAKLGV